jgi:membrane protein CcdC involved in cytochrome C biogenesis
MDDPRKPQPPLPAGYRQGVISAITVVIGFSLLFMRYWNFEVKGRVTYTAVAAALVLMVANLLEFYALFRALQPEDEQESEYRKTLRWFMASVAVLFVSVTIASLATTGLAP